MASSLLQVRIDENLRKEAEEIFHNLGLNLSSAVRLFLNRVIIAQGLPFPMNLESETQPFDPTDCLNHVEQPRQESDFDPVKYLDDMAKEMEE